MTFSEEWHEVYASGREQVNWPWSDVVSLATRFGGDLKDKRVLELGCGTGANLEFFRKSKAIYHGMDGNPKALENIRCRRLSVGDFTVALPYINMDMIFDRAAVAHNDTSGIKDCLGLVSDTLKSGGIYIGVDWFSHQHDEYAKGEPDIDEFTKTDYTDGQFTGVGRVHFSDEGHLRDLFSYFTILHLEEKVKTNALTGAKAATWNIVVRKP